MAILLNPVKTVSQFQDAMPTKARSLLWQLLRDASPREHACAKLISALMVTWAWLKSAIFSTMLCFILQSLSRRPAASIQNVQSVDESYVTLGGVYRPALRSVTRGWGVTSFPEKSVT